MDHAMLCAAAADALLVEESAPKEWPARKRWEWLTEVELCARMRDAILRAGTDPYVVRLNAQGRRAQGATNHDIEIGLPLSAAVEVVFAFAKRTASPAQPVEDDLKWMVEKPNRHVVVFFPTLREGYRIQKHRTAYDPAGNPITLQADEMLLCDSLQVAGLWRSMEFFDGLFDEIEDPVAGESARWTVAGTPVHAATFTVGLLEVVRTTCGKRSDRLWASVWSSRQA